MNENPIRVVKETFTKTMNRLAKDGANQDLTLVNELTKRINNFSIEYRNRLRNYYDMHFENVQAYHISVIDEDIINFNNEKELLYHHISRELHKFHQEYLKKLKLTLAKNNTLELSREISKNPSNNSIDSDENTVPLNNQYFNVRNGITTEVANHQIPKINNNNFLYQEEEQFNKSITDHCFEIKNVEWKPGLCLEVERPNALVITEEKKIYNLGEGKLVVAFKGISDGGMSYWAGGFHQKMISIKNLEPKISAEIPESEETITQIVKVDNQFYFSFTDFGTVQILNFDGEQKRELKLGKEFFDGGLVTCHLTYKNQIILGISNGTLMVIEYNYQDYSIENFYKEGDHSKRILALLWIDEEKRIFLTASEDRFMNKMKLAKNKKLILVTKYKFDEVIYSMVKLHSFVLLGLSNLIVVIFDPNESGGIILGMSAKHYKKQRNNYKYLNYFSSLAYFFKGEESRILKLAQEAKKNEKAFEEYVSRLRVLAKTEDGILYILGYPKGSDDNQVLDLFESKNINTKQVIDLPFFVERLDSSRMQVRTFATEITPMNTSVIRLSEFVIDLSARF